MNINDKKKVKDFMDNTDINILNALIDNSRTNSSEIAERIGVSVTTVIERIKKLEASGIIRKYTAIIDQSLLGRDVTALIMVSLEHPKYNDGFVEAMLKNESIIECHYVAGDFDYLVKVITENSNRLERVLNDIKSVAGVQKTKTMFVLSTLKNDFSAKI